MIDAFSCLNQQGKTLSAMITSRAISVISWVMLRPGIQKIHEVTKPKFVKAIAYLDIER